MSAATCSICQVEFTAKSMVLTPCGSCSNTIHVKCGDNLHEKTPSEEKKTACPSCRAKNAFPLVPLLPPQRFTPSPFLEQPVAASKKKRGTSSVEQKQKKRAKTGNEENINPATSGLTREQQEKNDYDEAVRLSMLPETSRHTQRNPLSTLPRPTFPYQSRPIQDASYTTSVTSSIPTFTASYHYASHNPCGTYAADIEEPGTYAADIEEPGTYDADIEEALRLSMQQTQNRGSNPLSFQEDEFIKQAMYMSMLPGSH